ncbi:cobalamin-binding protein [Desertivirga arenae]|uniref:cobalamin-binding protein n=1 Tax=Desertivirga arenae TaxID=2810309 RepID=UPI001A96152E|nr:cobalamin-binding protein [Pedobacter sp. SYSU D00823]
MSSKKIVSLLPSSTEIIYALGLEEQLVGRSHECDFPEAVKALPECSSALIEEGGTSREIDTIVRQSVADALSVYKVDADLLRKLSPDVIITQAQCEVCAVSLTDVEKAIGDDLNRAVEVISLSPETLDQILSDIATVAQKLEVQERGKNLIEELEERRDLIKHKLKFVESKPKVACIEWLDPLMTAGNWTPELIEIAGGVPVLAITGSHSPYIKPEDLVEANPDIIVVAACGFSIERSLQEISLLMQLPGWNELEAVKNNKLFIADGNHYFNRPGPRIIDTIEILAEIINPKQFIFGYEGQGWVKFDLL